MRSILTLISLGFFSIGNAQAKLSKSDMVKVDFRILAEKKKRLQEKNPEAIAAYRRGEGAAGPGWFRALDDQKIGRALAALHRDPAAAWTVGLLAGTVAMSPSRFAARFRETTGQSVMSCVAAWRMTVACRLLRDSGDGLAEIAQRVGYQDVAAFSRAFKALVGVSPSQWRNTPSPRASRSQ